MSARKRYKSNGLICGQKCDPEAASTVFSNAILAEKTTLIALDLTHQVIASKPISEMVRHGTAQDGPDSRPTHFRELFWSILMYFEKTYADVFGMTDGPPLHDPIAMFAALLPECFDDRAGERFAVFVHSAGTYSAPSKRTDHSGRTIAKRLNPGEAGIRIPVGVQQDVFWACIEKAMKLAEEASPL